jgi:hypothetical protein
MPKPPCGSSHPPVFRRNRRLAVIVSKALAQKDRASFGGHPRGEVRTIRKDPDR